jgi:hypothetical protein
MASRVFDDAVLASAGSASAIAVSCAGVTLTNRDGKPWWSDIAHCFLADTIALCQRL